MSKEEQTNGTLLNLNRPKLPDLPIKVTTDLLSQTEGRGLMQNSRGTRALVDAVMFGHPWVARWGDEYAQTKVEYLLNMSISMDGEGRRELVSCLEAGGQIPDGYYTQNGGGNPRGDTGYMVMRREE